ncbi:cilium assembly protein DZIP1L-like isoform X2 [Corticium candelabrum]|uniref:cilium assembly protein DZIP1L-like isoform X2 n=1 Tax=Corticium candelabrum TaxID=121492 RepID=UPI002E270AE5|nr:cilium assembly protein DZIP1L-like isoform X2 [Corticium candelabrum]
MSNFGVAVAASGVDTDHRKTVLSSFRKRKLRVDWRAIATLDLERLVQEVDVRSLQQNVMNVAFCDIEREDFSIDSNFLKLFRLAQLIIEYVLYCQKQLEIQVGELRKQQEELRKNESKLQQQVTTLQHDLTAVKRENKKRRKMLEAAQSLMNAGANGYHKCSMCSKAFVSGVFLQSHMNRRHGQQISLTLADGMMQQHSDRLKQAVETARHEALEDARSQYQVELQTALRNMQEKMDTVTEELRSEMSRKEEAAAQARETDLAEWRRAEEERRQREMMVLEQKIHKLEAEKADAVQEVAELKSQQAKRSNLGDLEDDDEDGGRRQSQRLQQEMLMQQREEHQSEIKRVRSEFADEMRKQEQKWKRRFKDVEAKHHKELEQHVTEVVATAELQKVERQPDVSALAFQLTGAKGVEVFEENRSPYPSSYEIVKPVTKAQPVSDISQSSEESEDDAKLSGNEGSLKDEAAVKQNGEGAVPVEQVKLPDRKVLKSPQHRRAVDENDGELSDNEYNVESVSPGEYVPFKSNPEVKTRYRHSDLALESQRTEVIDLLNAELLRKGISPESETLSLPQFKDKMACLEKEREVLLKKHRNSFEIRRKKESEIAKIIRTSYKPILAESYKKPPRVQKQPQDVRSDHTASPLSARPKAPLPDKRSTTVQPKPQVRPKEQLSNGTMYTEKSDDDDDDDDDDVDDDDDDNDDSLTETMTESATPSVSPEQRRQNQAVTTRPLSAEVPKSQPAVSTSTPQSGSRVSAVVRMFSADSGLSDHNEQHVLPTIRPALGKQETSWDSEGSSLSPSEKEEPNRGSLFSARTTAQPTSDNVHSTAGGQSRSSQSTEVQTRRDSNQPKQGTGKVAALANRLSASISLSPDPGKRPKGGVALFGGPAVDRGAVDVSDDDFSSVTEMDDFSEAKHSASGVVASRPSNELEDLDDVLDSPPAGLQSRAKVPSSAVTAFNQRDDFSDFDDDDFETTNLQH